LRAALAWCEKVGDVDTWRRLASSVYWFWYISGHWSEGRRWLEESLSAGEGTEPSALFWAVSGAALFAMQQGDIERER
jgi:predicted ATPase